MKRLEQISVLKVLVTGFEENSTLQVPWKQEERTYANELKVGVYTPFFCSFDKSSTF